MPKYRAKIVARNLVVDMDGRMSKHGFITWKFVEALNATSAEELAIQMIRDDEELRTLVQNDSTDPPTMHVTEIAEIESLDGIDTDLGRVWFEEKPKRWWQFWRRS